MRRCVKLGTVARETGQVLGVESGEWCRCLNPGENTASLLDTNDGIRVSPLAQSRLPFGVISRRI